MAPVTAPTQVVTNRQIVETWGWLIAQEKQVAGIEINSDELSAFLKGFSDGLNDRTAPYNLQKIYWDIDALAKVRREKVERAIERRNETRGKTFFTELKTNTNVVELPVGAYCEIIRPGNGARPKLQQTVNLHCTGRLIDGTEFYQTGPVDMILVTNHGICRGWVEAMQRINTGGAIKLYVPPPLPEADAVGFGIQPGSTMIFEIELLGVKDTAPQDLADVLTPLPPSPPPPPPSGFTDAQIIESWGWTLAAETHAAKFGLSKAEISALLAGLAAGVKGEAAPYDLESSEPKVEQFVDDHLEQARQTFKQKQLDDMKALFVRLKQNTNVIELPSGLRYEILKPGRGPYPKPGQRVKVNYTGRLINGTVFDSTAIGPLDIDLDKVIPGWTEGVQKINLGGKIKLYIPPALGYGDEAASGIPATSTLIFEIELLEIKDTPKSDTTPGTEQK